MSMPRGPLTSIGAGSDVTVAGIPLHLVSASYKVTEAPRFGEKISTGSLRYADFNTYESAHAVSSFVGGYGLRRYADAPQADDPDLQTCYDEADDCDGRFGPMLLAPQRLTESTGLNGPIIWMGQFTPAHGSLQGQTQFIAVGGTGIAHRHEDGSWHVHSTSLPAVARKGAVGVFNGRLIIGFGADAPAVWSDDIATTTLIHQLDGLPLYAYAFTADRAATYIAGGLGAMDDQIVASTDGITDYDTDNAVLCTPGEGRITSLAPGGGLALLYVGREHELGEVDNNGVYRSLLPLDSNLPTNCQPMRWALGGIGEGEQRGPVRLFFARDRSIWSYQPSSGDAGSAENVSVWAKQGFRPQTIRGIPTALQGTARWLYYTTARETGNLSANPSPFRTGAPNLVSNPSFETNLAGWSVFGAGTSSLRTTNDAADGVASLELTFDGVSSFYGRQISVSGLIPGTQYTLSAEILQNTSQGSVNVDIVEGAIGLDTTGILIPSGTAGWQRISQMFTYPLGGSGTVFLRCFMDGVPVGSIKFDAIQLEPSVSEVASYLLAMDTQSGKPHPIGSLGDVRADAMGITSLFGPNPLLFVGAGADVQRLLLPLDGENPIDDSATRYQLRGSFTMPDIDLGFPDEDKIGLFFRIVGTAEQEGLNDGLQPGDHVIDVEISFDGGPYVAVGTASTSPSVELAIPGTPAFKRAKPRFTLRTKDPSTTPQLLGFSMRVSLNAKLYRVWEFLAQMPADVFPSGGQDLQNPQDVIDEFWRLRRRGTPVSFEDRWNFTYNVRILAFGEQEIAEESLQTPETALSFRLLEVVGPTAGPYGLAYGDPRSIYGGAMPNSTYGLEE